MRIIALSTLKFFWEENLKYQDAKEPPLAWHRHTLHADWSSPAEVKQDFRNASILKHGRVVFNIAGEQVSTCCLDKLRLSRRIHPLYWHSRAV